MKHVYLREIRPAANDSLSLIAGQIGRGSRALDVGTGSGALGRFLSANSCTIDGITYSHAEAELARQHYRRLEVIDLETVVPSSAFPQQSYDVIVCADVLEHLRNADQILRDLRTLLAPGGRLLISIPNVTYMGVIASLFASKFVRTAEGLLDSTHVRFFDRGSLEQFVADCGLQVLRVMDLRKNLCESEFSQLDSLAFPPVIRSFLTQQPDATVYQFIWELAPDDGRALDTAPTEAPTVPAVPITPMFEAQIFPERGAGIDESTSSRAWGRLDDEVQTLVFPDQISGSDLKAIRADLADRPGMFEFLGICARDDNGEIRWRWEGDWSAGLQANDLEITATRGPNGGRLARSTGKDPWVMIPVRADHWNCLCTLELTLTAPQPYLDLAFASAERRYRKHVEQLDSSIARLTASLETSLQEITDQRQEITDQRQEIAALRNELRTRDHSVAALDSELRAVYASSSWRYTRWLRNARAYLVSLKSGKDGSR